jgi:hypothetical protein
MTRLRCLAAAMVLSALAPATAGAQETTATSAQAPADQRPWYKQVTVNGLASVSFTANLNRPASGASQFRAFDLDDSSLQLDVGELVVQRAIEDPGRAGFRVDLTLGRPFARVIASPDLFRRDDGEAGAFDIHQAFVSYIAKVGTGLRVDAGKFVTPFGYEVIDGYDGVNANASRSLLFTLAEPGTHTGVRVSYSPSETVGLQAMAVQGWDVVRDNNHGKTAGVQLSLTPREIFSAYLNYIVGAEQDGGASLRHAFSAVAVAKVTQGLTLAGSLEAGREGDVRIEESAGGGPLDASWTGLAGYATIAASERFTATVRFEWFDDSGGARTGFVQTLREVTLTPSLEIGRHVVLRGDLRRDWSNRRVFDSEDGGLRRSQVTASANAILIF